MHIFGERTQVIVHETVCFLICRRSRGRVDDPGSARAVTGAPLSPSASLVQVGAWPLPSLPKEKAFSQQVGTGKGTACPHPTLNLISATVPPETSGHRGAFLQAGAGARTDFRHECSFLGSEDLGTHRELSVSPPGFLGLPLCPAVLPCRLRSLPFPPPPFLLFPGPCHWASARWVLTHRASARGRIRSQTLRLVPCAPRKFAPARSFLSQLQKLFTWEARVPLRGGAGLGRQPRVLRLQALGNTANFSKHAGLAMPLQTATRTRIFLPPPPLLSVTRPPDARVSACVRPMPKLGGVYYCTNSSSDTP